MSESSNYKEFQKRSTLSEEENQEIKVPSHIAQYKVESLLNRGGMSLLYLGINPENKEPITIKVLLQEYLSNPEMVDRFLHESAIIEITDHPNIVRLYGHGRWEGGLYIAMEFIQGISLRQLILQQTLSLKRALEIVLQIAHALLHLHSHGIIHRDLKPENILLTAQGGIKVVDFGIAALFSEKEVKEGKRKRRFMGTPVYMSPEQEEDPLNVTFATDIYSLGVVTYELVLGRLSHGVIHLGMLPLRLAKILAKALETDLSKRYSDIVDFIHDISSYLSSDDLKRDMRGRDYLGELTENLQAAKALLMTPIPDWPHMDMGMSTNVNAAVSTTYFDFFEKSNNVFSIALGESLTTGVEGLLSIALLRGMVRTLATVTENPRELIEKLNDLLIEEKGEKAISFSFLTLYPAENRFTYIASGYSPLWFLPAAANTPRRFDSENLALGLTRPYTAFEIESNWNVGDKIILHSFQAGLAKKISDLEVQENEFSLSLTEHLFLPPKQQVDAIVRRLSRKEKGLSERMIMVISLLRL